MKKKFYIIAHNPNTIGRVLGALSDGANALEPDIFFDDDEKIFYAFDPPRGHGFGRTLLTDYCSGLAQVLINNPNFNLALIAWDLKNVDDSGFIFTTVKDIIQTNFLDVLAANNYPEMPMLFTHPTDYTYLLNSVAPNLKSNWALGTDGIHNTMLVHSKFSNHGFCYSYADGISFPPVTGANASFLPQILLAIAARNTGNSFSFVYAWTVNVVSLMKAYLDAGIDGIITDDVAQLRALIGGNGFPDAEYTSKFELATSADNPFNCQHPVVGTPAPEPTKPDFKVKTYKFIQGEMFVAINSNGKGTLLKTPSRASVVWRSKKGSLVRMNY